jgi:ABC-type nitrate/sulfonate/bicarbonate transport system ATPase subunit
MIDKTTVDGAWLGALRAELLRRGVPMEASDHVVAEAAGHLRDSGERAVGAFGPPAAYAAAVAESLAAPPVPQAPQAPAAPTRPPGVEGWAPARQGGRRDPGPDRRPLLRATGISKRYGRRTVLSDVHLTVRSGEVAAVVGANGCGKSTFLRICAGLVSPDSGEVVVDGRLGFCPQEGGTYDFLRPDEHFVLVGAGSDWSRRRSRAAGMAGAADLDWDAATPTLARHLSGGTRQKLNLVLAGIGEPAVLLLDEPYQGFDQGAYLDFWQQVVRWRERGAAVVVVTHLLSHLHLADTVLDLTAAERSHRR